jgi:hypothetical protein
MKHTIYRLERISGRQRRLSYSPCCLEWRRRPETFSTECVSSQSRQATLTRPQIYSLFAKLSDAVSPTFFLQNMFLTLISNPSSRLAVLNYLSKSLVRPPEVDQNSADVGLIMRGVAAALEDENMLVRRNGLDLLLRILHLDGNIFK